MEDNFIMKLTQLEYFCVAARYHNITKAAKELFVTQPSISNAIRALEEVHTGNLENFLSKNRLIQFFIRNIQDNCPAATATARTVAFKVFDGALQSKSK